MAFILGCVIVAFFLVIILYKKKIRFSFSIVLLVLLGISLVSSICLAQNYTQSLVPGINDGIGVSNSLAHLIIGERQWSTQLFRSYFDVSVYITLIILLLLTASVIIESMKYRKR